MTRAKPLRAWRSETCLTSVGVAPAGVLAAASGANAAQSRLTVRKRNGFRVRDNPGTRRNRSNVTRQILQPAIDRANVELARAGRPALEGIANHSLRRTLASLLYEAGASPAYVTSQMGHEDSDLALEIHAKVVERKREVGAAMDALIRGADRAPTGISTDTAPAVLLSDQTKGPDYQGLSQLRD